MVGASVNSGRTLRTMVWLGGRRDPGDLSKCHPCLASTWIAYIVHLFNEMGGDCAWLKVSNSSSLDISSLQRGRKLYAVGNNVLILSCLSGRKINIFIYT